MESHFFHFVDVEVEIAPKALETMLSYRQKRFYSSEAGGQMFARITPRKWRIEIATGPRSGDKRGRFHFWPDRKAEQDEIHRYFQQGLEFVGDWHTHPEDIPRPSRPDVKSVENVVRESTHELPGFLMCIIGRREPPTGLWLSLHYRDGRSSMSGRPAGMTDNKLGLT